MRAGKTTYRQQVLMIEITFEMQVSVFCFRYFNSFISFCAYSMITKRERQQQGSQLIFRTWIIQVTLDNSDYSLRQVCGDSGSCRKRPQITTQPDKRTCTRNQTRQLLSMISFYLVLQRQNLSDYDYNYWTKITISITNFEFVLPTSA